MKFLWLFLCSVTVFLFASCKVQVETPKSSMPINYTINYETEYGKAPQSITVLENTILSENQLPSLSVQGFSFIGWYDENTKVEPGTYKVTKDITLSAKWNIVNYTVSFDAKNGSPVELLIIQEGKKVTKPENPTKESTETETYIFEDWYTLEDDGVTLFSEPFDFTKPITKDITLYAKWNTNSIYYTITYETELGTAPQQITVLANSFISQEHLPELNAAGNSFVGWFYENTRIVAKEYRVTKDIKLTAKWNVIIYTVSFDTKDGTEISNQSIESGKCAYRPVNPNKSATETETYVFADWYTSENGGETLSTEPFEFDTPITKDIILYAKWTVTPITYTITYSSEYGTTPNSITMPAKTILYGGQLPVLTKDYFTFKGWYDGNTKAEPGTYRITKDVTLVAKWEKIYYTVSFNTNGGSSIVSQSVEGGGIASKPEDPIKPDSQTETYTFENWYTSTDDGNTLSDVFDFNTLITDNVTLYAKWTQSIITYTVSYMSDRGTIPASFTVNATTVLSENELPELFVDGYYFYGWYDDNIKAEPGEYIVSKDVNLTAKWDFDDPLTLEFQGSGKITITGMWNTLKYANNGGDIVKATSTITVNAGDKISFYASASANKGFIGGMNINCSTDCYVYGNIMSLVSFDLETGDWNPLATELTEAAFEGLFKNNTYLHNHDTKSLFLPATTLADHCYSGMFYCCENLTKAPALPANTLAPSCYASMFYSCYNLANAPELSATNLASNCYSCMFQNCKELKEAPSLPATTLADSCYSNMFGGCKALTKAPVLPATTLSDYCYYGMFHGCIKLTTAPILPATTLAEHCYEDIFSSCESLKRGPTLPATILAPYCYSYMFSNCVSLTNCPVLSATTLAEHCYQGMLSGCDSLKSRPSLPATILAPYCYASMFSNCDGLESSPVLSATTLAEHCYECMFAGCVNLTTITELPATTLSPYCYSGMFSNCKKIITAPMLPATILVDNCYDCMFYNCENLNYVKCLATDMTANGCTSNFLYNVSESGTYVKSRLINGLPSCVPYGWTIQEMD